MAIGLIGRKAGMTRIFSGNGESVPVTVIEVRRNRVVRVRTVESNGYSAVQVTAGVAASGRLGKADAGQFTSVDIEPGLGLWEFRAAPSDLEGLKAGDPITVDRFAVGQKVDITGTSRGKGYQGAVKRWNFATQDATHGNSLSHRAPGSIGQRQSPGRVFKGKKMAGRMGGEQVTVQGLEVIRVDADKSLLLIRGAVPGAPGNEVVVRPAVKS